MKFGIYLSADDPLWFEEDIESSLCGTKWLGEDFPNVVIVTPSLYSLVSPHCILRNFLLLILPGRSKLVSSFLLIAHFDVTLTVVSLSLPCYSLFLLLRGTRTLSVCILCVTQIHNGQIFDFLSKYYFGAILFSKSLNLNVPKL